VGITPSQPVAISPPGELPAATSGLPESLFEDLWQQSDADACDLDRGEFTTILIACGSKQNYGHPPGIAPTPEVQAAYLRSLRLADLALAHACAQGKPRAWERFLALYQQPLTRAAIAIAGNETQGRELADSLYAELYGLHLRDGHRRSPLASYQGRGSLLGWLRTTVAQRHIDHHRKTWREEQLPDPAAESPTSDPPAPTPAEAPNPEELTLLAAAIQQSLAHQSAEDRFLLAAYYLDQRTLAQIARTLNVHEATISRKLRRAVEDLRKTLLGNLQQRGLSKRAAQEALGADPRDLTGVDAMAGMSDLDRQFKKLLQFSQSGAFPEKAGL
jgi:RNA polymerase sigma-70 factor (ECF subfamily)